MKLSNYFIVGGLALTPLTAWPGGMGEIQINTPDDFVYIALHGTVGIRERHPIIVEPFWFGAGSIEDETFFSDELSIRLDVHHQIPPHGEGPSPFWMNCRIFQDSADMAVGGNTWPRTPENWAEFPHVNHFDQYTCTLDSIVKPIGGFQRYEKFVFISVGRHTPKRLPRKVGRNERERRGRASTENAIGGAFATIDPVTRSLFLVVGVAGIQSSDILSAHLHLGGPNEKGPPLLDLGPGWTDLDGAGVALFMPVAILPPPFDLEFLNSRTYIDIHTKNQPEGAVRLQMSEPPEAMTPTAFAITKGRPLGGGLQEILLPDDLYAVVGSSAPLLVSDPNLQVVIEGISPVSNPQFLELLIQSSCTAFPLENTPMTIEYFNFETQSWERVLTSIPTQRDGGISIEISDRPQRFIQSGTRKVVARIGIFDRGSATATFLARFDQMIWFVVP